jgi:ParB/RepB/Spo0J family partition protein
MSSAKHLQRILGTRIESDAAHAGPAIGVSALTVAKIIPIERVVPDPDQPRREFDDVEMKHLIGSLRDLGQTDPVKVRWDAKRDRYVLIDGERRWRAATPAGLLTLTAIVDNRNMEADRVLEMQIVENALRQDLTTLEAGAAYRTLMQAWGCTQQQLAERLHISQSKVSRALAALDLPADLQTAVESGDVAPVAAVKKASSRSGRRKPTKPKAVRIATTAGTVVVTPKPGQSVADVLVAALDAERMRGAA